MLQISVIALSKSVSKFLNCRQAKDYDHPAAGATEKEVQAFIQEQTEYECRVCREEKERQQLAKEMPVCEEMQKARSSFAAGEGVLAAAAHTAVHRALTVVLNVRRCAHSRKYVVKGLTESRDPI